MKKIYLTENAICLLIEAMSADDIHAKYYNSIPIDEFHKIIQADPTWRSEKPQKMGKYGKWLLKLYGMHQLNLEDLYKAHQYLEFFTKYLNRIETKDIGKYNSLPALYQAVKPFMDNPNQATSHKDEIRKIKEGAEKVYEDNEWMIIVPHTEEASCYYGKGTEWCTAAEYSYNKFDEYNRKGRLYININKQTHEKYQFHFPTSSFMDATDSPIEMPIAKSIELSKGALDWYMRHVQGASMLIEEKYTIECWNGEDEVYLQTHHYDEKRYGWYLYEGERLIAADLTNISEADIYQIRDGFNDDRYYLFDNLYGKKSLVTLSEDNELDLYSTDVEKIAEITNQNITEFENYNIIGIYYTNGEYEIINTFDTSPIYKTKNAAKVDFVFHVGFPDVCAVEFNNGKAILCNSDYYSEEFYLDPSDIGERDIFSDEGDRIIITMNNGEQLIFNSYSLEQIGND